MADIGRGELRTRVYAILELAEAGDWRSKVFDYFIISLIFINVLAVIVGSIDSVSVRFDAFLRYLEFCSVLIFTFEYLLRVWSCTSLPRFRSPLFGRLRFMVSPLALVDLMAILPFFLPMLIATDLRILRIFRLFRLARLFKLARYSESVRLLGDVFRARKEELVITGVALAVALILSSSAMYVLEHDAQPEVFSSIPQSMWWAVATLSTVGYGDTYPVTALGKLAAGFIALIGIGIFALPAGILSSGFTEIVKERQDKKTRICPHCGKVVEFS